MTAGGLACRQGFCPGVLAGLHKQIRAAFTSLFQSTFQSVCSALPCRPSQPLHPRLSSLPHLLPYPSRPTWDDQQHVDTNYERAGLVADVNAAFGRNRRRDVLREKAEAAPEMLDAPIQDDELKAACAQVGHDARGGEGGPARSDCLRRCRVAVRGGLRHGAAAPAQCSKAGS